MSTVTPKPLHPEFKELLDRQPYSVVLDGLRLTVERDVFPPDLGQCAQNVARLSRVYAARSALDMGCGSGYLALCLKRGGVPEVWASDIHAPAVACARANVAQNAEVGPITTVQSDLFENIPTGKRFDLIIFNQPYGPGPTERVCGCGPDGGYEICKRFLLAAPGHLTEAGVIVMSFSDREDARHDPKRVAEELGYSVTTILHKYYNLANNFIYEIRPRR